MNFCYGQKVLYFTNLVCTTKFLKYKFLENFQLYGRFELELKCYILLEGVTEGALLRDLIFVFQDIEGKYIRYNHKEEGFRILPQVSASLAYVLYVCMVV